MLQASSGSGVVQRELELPEDDEFSRAISLSLKVCKYCLLFSYSMLFFSYLSLVQLYWDQTAEQEKTIRGQGVKDRDRKLEVYDLVKEAEKTNNSTGKVYTLSCRFCLAQTTGFADIVSYIPVLSSKYGHPFDSARKIISPRGS